MGEGRNPAIGTLTLVLTAVLAASAWASGELDTRTLPAAAPLLLANTLPLLLVRRNPLLVVLLFGVTYPL